MAMYMNFYLVSVATPQFRRDLHLYCKWTLLVYVLTYCDDCLLFLCVCVWGLFCLFPLLVLLLISKEPETGSVHTAELCLTSESEVIAGNAVCSERILTRLWQNLYFCHVLCSHR